MTFSEKLLLNQVYESCGLLNLGFLFTVLISVYPSWFQIFLAFYMSLISHWGHELIRWNVDVWLLRIWKYFPFTCKTMERKLAICLRGTWIDSLTEHVFQWPTGWQEVLSIRWGLSFWKDNPQGDAPSSPGMSGSDCIQSHKLTKCTLCWAMVFTFVFMSL